MQNPEGGPTLARARRREQTEQSGGAADGYGRLAGLPVLVRKLERYCMAGCTMV